MVGSTDALCDVLVWMNVVLLPAIPATHRGFMSLPVGRFVNPRLRLLAYAVCSFLADYWAVSANLSAVVKNSQQARLRLRILSMEKQRRKTPSLSLGSDFKGDEIFSPHDLGCREFLAVGCVGHGCKRM